MEHVCCDLCGADNPRAFLNRSDRFSKEEFQYVICTQCGLIYLNPRPTQPEILNYYPDEYEAYQSIQEVTSQLQRWHLNQALDKKSDFVERYSEKRGQLLDVGCATGDFIKTASDRGWEVTGIELAEKAARIAQEQYDLDVLTGTLESVQLPSEFFDVITLWDVLEHLPSPKTALGRAHILLKKDGLLVISVPNVNSFDRRLFGHSWIGWDAPRHYYLFPHASIEKLFRETGFTLVSEKCFLGGKGAFLLSLDQALRNRDDASSIKKFYPLMSYALWPYRQIAYLFNRGPVITIIGRKTSG